MNRTANAPRPARPFLTARWSNPILVTYAVEPAILEPHLPPGCELDRLDGDAHVSLVAFDFLETRVRGIRWPGYVNFPEINLRFYVRLGNDRGVVFIREYVPKRAICWIARAIYNEPYHRAPMTSRVEDNGSSRIVEHALVVGGRTHRVHIAADLPGSVPPSDSVEHYFKEHRWGFGCDRRGATTRYEVIHDAWPVLPVRSHSMDWDFSAAYGERWRFLNAQAPRSVILAEGSRVEVRRAGVVRMKSP